MEYAWQRYFAIGKSSITEEMRAAIICREMGWTYLEYLEQPALITENVWAMLQAEATQTKKSLSKA